MTLNANTDGDKTDATDTLNFVLTDTDAEGLYNQLGLSLNDDTPPGYVLARGKFHVVSPGD